MKPKHTSEKGQSLRIFWLFLTAVIVLIIVSLLFKLPSLVATSSFDARHQFTLAVLEQPVRIVSFSPDAQTLSVLTITEVKNPTKKEIESVLSLPVDAIVSGSNGTVLWENEKEQKANITAILQSILFGSPKTENINAFDSARLWILIQPITSEAILSETVSVNDKVEEKEKVITELFSDKSLTDEAKSIQIVNGTGIAGFGNTYANRLTNIGANVISVTTARTSVPITTVQYFGEPSYTVEKIEKIVGKQATESKKQHISDIIVTLGKDLGKK